jgi:hypothetical protein
MGRTVISRKDLRRLELKAAGETTEAEGKGPATPGQLPEVDKYTSRLLKYIPAEVLVLYLTLDAIIRSSGKISLAGYWAIFILGIFGTYLYLWRVERVQKQLQLLISVGAYCIWVFTLGGPFVHLAWYDPIYGSLALPIYTFFIPIIEA